MPEVPIFCTRVVAPLIAHHGSRQIKVVRALTARPVSKFVVVVCGPDNTNDYEDTRRRNYYRAEYPQGRRYRIAPAQP